MSARNYNKLYVPSNKNNSEKIWMGYQQDTQDIILNKDKETYFHVPFFTTPLKLVDSSLISDGAVGGAFPAASDRIWKNQKDYGNNTPYGNPISSIADGTWFCSWLYKAPNGKLQWYDRYYKTGTFKYTIAFSQLNDGLAESEYTDSKLIFRDVPSTMIFDPSVMYKYYHVGEKTAQFLVSTLGGNNQEKLALNILNWGNESDKIEIKNNLPIKITTNASFSELYSSVLMDSTRIESPTISFNNNKEIEIFLEFNEKYNFENEFTLAFWSESNNWQDSQTTMLAGNYTPNGGYGVFVQNLSTFPFFVIPETGYGHLLFINDKFRAFLDKSLQKTTSLTATPEFVAIDFENNVIVANNDSSGELIKFDNTGKVLASNKLTDTIFNFQSTDEKPLQLICDINDQVKMLSTRAIYTFDTDLNLINTLQWSLTSTSVAAFQYNPQTDTHQLIIRDDVADMKFLEEQQWYISLSDGNLYKKDIGSDPQLFFDFRGQKATKLSIDPFNKIWVLYGTNKLAIFDSNALPLTNPISFTTLGIDRNYTLKNINFICTYDRNTQSKTWKCIVYYSDEPIVFILNMQGILKEQYELRAFFNYNIINSLDQDYEKFKFTNKGDFTGYEHRRVFGKLSPYNNESQLILKAAVKDKQKKDLFFKTFKNQTSIKDWERNSWQHIAVTLKNREFLLYINGSEVMKLPFSGRYELSYENEPGFYIGTTAGSQIGYNQEIKTISKIFNGKIENIKIYNYSLKQQEILFLLRASILGENMVWSLPTPILQYLEKIERMFKHRLPGAKSTFYNLKIAKSLIKDEKTKEIIEQQLKDFVETINPAYSSLLKVHWID
jgi:hypothetical protein